MYPSTRGIHRSSLRVSSLLFQSTTVCPTQFGGIWAFLQQRALMPAVALLVSSGVWYIAADNDHMPLRSSTGVLIPLVMVPQPMMHIQLSGNSRLFCTNLQHTDSPPTHLIVQMVSSTHAFRFGYLGFRGTIVACELKHRSGKPLFKALRCDRNQQHLPNSFISDFSWHTQPSASEITLFLCHINLGLIYIFINNHKETDQLCE
ncbi:hypothetical protein AVEN_101526-1 [Araneus ventricosus]|uniref:Uncharacterized protein n=1 Tax=Araneus ventricosus TaxID=182803 RepID=A0A4Y2GQL7_ARAVE|nr:hypothetical protein AVEN_101526-1 [Araneus ventricosus]